MSTLTPPTRHGCLFRNPQGTAPRARGATADLAGDLSVSRLFVDLIVAAACEDLRTAPS
jgi:hypothetical protein